MDQLNGMFPMGMTQLLCLVEVNCPEKMSPLFKVHGRCEACNWHFPAGLMTE